MVHLSPRRLTFTTSDERLCSLAILLQICPLVNKKLLSLPHLKPFYLDNYSTKRRGNLSPRLNYFVLILMILRLPIVSFFPLKPQRYPDEVSWYDFVNFNK